MFDFVGTSIADIQNTSEANPTTANTTPSEIGPRVKEGIQTVIGRANIDLSGAPEMWIGFYMWAGADAANATYTTTLYFLEINDSELTLGVSQPAMLSLAISSNSAITLRLRNAAASVVTLPTVPYALSDRTLNRIDMHVKFDTVDGFIRMYRGGDLIYEFVGQTLYDAARVADLLTFSRSRASGTNVRTVYSNILVGPTDTRAIDIVQRYPTADSDLTEWTGSFADVTGPGYTAATFIESSAVDQIELFETTDDISTVPDIEIIGVFHSVRARRIKENEGALASVIRVAGEEYESTPQNPDYLAPSTHLFAFLENPATAAPWTKADLADTDFGVVAKLAQA